MPGLALEQAEADGGHYLHIGAFLPEPGQNLHQAVGGAGPPENHRPGLLLIFIVVLEDVGPFGRLQVRWNFQFVSLGHGDGRPGEVQSDDGHIGGQGGPQGRGHFVVFPGIKVEHVPLGKQLRYPRRENAEVGPAVLGRLGTGVPGHPQQPPHLELRILGYLAE